MTNTNVESSAFGQAGAKFIAAKKNYKVPLNNNFHTVPDDINVPNATMEL